MHGRHHFTLASKCVLGGSHGQRNLHVRLAGNTRTLEEALGRLHTDYIDLYYSYKLDRQVSIEESVGALAQAARTIGEIGLSELSATTLRRAHGVHPIAAIHAKCSTWTRNPKIAVLDAYAARATGFIVFSRAAREMLAGGAAQRGYRRAICRPTCRAFRVTISRRIWKWLRVSGDSCGRQGAAVHGLGAVAAVLRRSHSGRDADRASR